MDPRVVRNDAITVDEIAKMAPDAIIISPGPGTPDEAGISIDVVQKLGKHIPILGVCLGHQAIGQAFGAKIVRAPELMHGKVSPITHQSESVFHGVENGFMATRYHSLIIAPETLPASLKVTASAGETLIMAVEHPEFPIVGVQFLSLIHI